MIESSFAPATVVDVPHNHMPLSDTVPFADPTLCDDASTQLSCVGRTAQQYHKSSKSASMPLSVSEVGTQVLVDESGSSLEIGFALLRRSPISVLARTTDPSRSGGECRDLHIGHSPVGTMGREASASTPLCRVPDTTRMQANCKAGFALGADTTPT